jgi:hypothetical protein
MMSGLFWRLNSGTEVHRILRMRQRRVAVSFNSPAKPVFAVQEECAQEEIEEDV